MMSEAIESMPAGRELDAEVAKALGWKDVHSAGSHDGCFIGFAPSPPNGNARFVPPYSTNIGAAWELVEFITDNQGPRFELANEGINWRVDVCEFTDQWVISFAPTAPLAIARAFLMHTNFMKQVKR